MAHFHIARIALSPHQAMYDELIAALAGGFAELGHICTTAVNETAAGAVNLLLGTTILGVRSLRLRSRLRGIPHIVYQLEQLDDSHGMLPERPDYRDLLTEATAIWDYAPSSAAYLRERGLSGVSLVPPCYHPCLETFRPAGDPDLDILLVGSPSPRRLILLEKLAAAGAKVGLANELYGRGRDALIARARIVVNIHNWDDLARLETIRLTHLLANRCFVISETGDHDPYEGGLIYAEYSDLVAVCLDWLKRPAVARDSVAEHGYRAVRRIGMAEILARAIGELGDLGRFAAPRQVSLIWPPLPIGGGEDSVLDRWSREGSGEGGILLLGDLPESLAARLEAASREADRPGLMADGDGDVRLLVLGGGSSYPECRAGLERRLGQVENYGVFALLGVGTAGGATRLHAEILAENRAVREICAAGGLRIFGSATYSAARISSVERTRAIRGSSFRIE